MATPEVGAPVVGAHEAGPVVPCRPHVKDRGSGTVWVIAMGALVLTGGWGATGFTEVVLCRQRASAAADLAALAGARAALAGPARACADARLIAARNGARLTMCTLDGLIINVSAVVSVPAPWASLGNAVARARAGPAILPRAA